MRLVWPPVSYLATVPAPTVPASVQPAKIFHFGCVFSFSAQNPSNGAMVTTAKERENVENEQNQTISGDIQRELTPGGGGYSFIWAI